MKRLDTIKDVVEFLGGSCEVARITGKNSQAVSNWQARGYIPARAFDLVDRALRRKRHSAPRDLFGFDRADAA
jgi:hypothetical protein